MKLERRVFQLASTKILKFIVLRLYKSFQNPINISIKEETNQINLLSVK
jgi:hypothetical protein